VKLQFSIRDLFWLTTIIAVGVGAILAGYRVYPGNEFIGGAIMGIGGLVIEVRVIVLLVKIYRQKGQ
jgi:hypothetical protein